MSINNLNRYTELICYIVMQRTDFKFKVKYKTDSDFKKKDLLNNETFYNIYINEKLTFMLIVMY